MAIHSAVGQRSRRIKAGLLAFVFHIDASASDRQALRSLRWYRWFRQWCCQRSPVLQLPRLLSHRRDVNQASESGGLLDLDLPASRCTDGSTVNLLDSSSAATPFRRRQLLQVSVKSKAGILLHQVLCSISNWSECHAGALPPAARCVSGNLAAVFMAQLIHQLVGRRSAAPAEQAPAQTGVFLLRQGFCRCAALRRSAAQWRPAPRLYAHQRTVRRRTALLVEQRRDWANRDGFSSSRISSSSITVSSAAVRD